MRAGAGLRDEAVLSWRLAPAQAQAYFSRKLGKCVSGLFSPERCRPYAADEGSSRSVYAARKENAHHVPIMA